MTYLQLVINFKITIRTPSESAPINLNNSEPLYLWLNTCTI